MSTLRFAAGACALVLVTACSSGSTKPSVEVDVRGRWDGSALLPQGRVASAELTQSGTQVGGTMSVTGAFLSLAVQGVIRERELTWEVERGCEVWSGVLTVDPGGREMSGTLRINRTGCSGQSDGTGTLVLGR